MLRCAALFVLIGSFFAGLWAASAQTTSGTPYQDGVDTAKAARAAVEDLPKDTSNTFTKDTVPFQEGNPIGITRENAEQEGVLSNAGAASQPYQDLVQSTQTQVKFDPLDMKALVANSNQIAGDPQTYLGGFDQAGNPITCQPVPNQGTTPLMYTAVCNTGSAVETGPQSCSVTLKHNFGPPQHKYSCSKLRVRGQICLQGTPTNCTEPDFIDEEIGTGCAELEAAPSCTASNHSSLRILAGGVRRPSTFYETTDYTCGDAVAGTVVPASRTVNGVTYSAAFNDLGMVTPYINSTPDETACSSLVASGQCSAPIDVCTDPSPATRLINGVSITQSCWAWTRTFTCNTVTTGHSDCSTLEQNTACRLDHTECLDDPPSGGECQVENRVYTCASSTTSNQPPVYVCSNGFYCQNGECQQVEATPSQDFPKAVAALSSVAQAGAELDPNSITIFVGRDMRCHKPVFGLTNCCNGGSGIPLIGVCSDEEKLLAKAIDDGLTHYVGSYCSSSFLGICKTRKQTYCTFQSKLGRIIQEQGRQQLGITWGTPKAPQCQGLTPDQFAALDMSKFDFSEVINDLQSLVTIPNEAQQLTDLQAKIQAYYSANPPK
jgi:conjugal transfer mating pair stabilization protein TraN